VGVIISTLLIQFYGWTGFDPIASLFIAVLIAASVVPLVIDTGKVLALDVGDRDGEILSALDEVCVVCLSFIVVDQSNLTMKLSSIEGLASYTSPRFWPKDSTSLIGSIHVQIKPLLVPALHSSESQSRAEIPGTSPRIDIGCRQG
jgi:zinc transporter 5/7